MVRVRLMLGVVLWLAGIVLGVECGCLEALIYVLPLDEQLYESSVHLLKLSDNRETH